MEAMFGEIPRIRAERLLDAAQAASFPRLDKAGRTRWLQQVGRASVRAQQAAGREQGGLTFNGQPMLTREAFKQQLTAAFGAGPIPLRPSPTRQRPRLPQSPQERADRQGGGDGQGLPRPAPSGPRPARHPFADWRNGTGDRAELRSVD